MKSIITVLPLLIVFALSGNGQTMAQDKTPHIKVFILKNTEARNALDVVEGLVHGAESGLRVVVDERTNSLIVAADTMHKLDEFQDLLNQIDVATKLHEEKTQMLEITLTMVMEGNDEIMDKSLAAPSEKVVELIKELGSNPYLPTFKNPRVGGTIMNRVMVDETQSQQFQGSSSSKESLCQLLFSGRASVLDSDRFIFDGKISINLKPSGDQLYSSQMATRVTVNKKHPVILGLTSIEGVNCLLIVEIR
jgi:hypothetical protein